MPLSQADLDNINAAIAIGELTVEVNGRRVTYRSVEQLKMAYEHVKAELAGQTNAGTATRRGVFHPRFTTARGF